MSFSYTLKIQHFSIVISGNLLQHTLYLWVSFPHVYWNLSTWPSYINKYIVSSYCSNLFLWRLICFFMILSLTRLKFIFSPYITFSRPLVFLLSLFWIPSSHFIAFLQFSPENSFCSWNILSWDFLPASTPHLLFSFCCPQPLTLQKYHIECCANA